MAESSNKIDMPQTSISSSGGSTTSATVLRYTGHAFCGQLYRPSARSSSMTVCGCGLCKPWKHAGHGDAYRIPPSALRAMGGRSRRVSRCDIGQRDGQAAS